MTPDADRTGPVPGSSVEVLIPAFDREGSLAVTLTGLLGQQEPPGRVLVSDQSPRSVLASSPLVVGVCRVLRARGVPVEILRHPSGEGVAENRAFLLDRAQAPYVLFLDDDIVLEPEGLARMCDAMGRFRTGIVAMAMTGLSHADDVREHEWAAFAPLTGDERPAPERIRKGDPGWERWRLHNAANPTHLGERLGLSRFERAWAAYRIAWAAGCVLFDRAELVASGGFDFWRELGRQGYGEDVVAQLRVQERTGAVGLLPTAAHHLELPTSVDTRERDAYELVFGSD